MALDAQILLSILAHESSSGDISRTLRATPASYSLTIGNGTGANQAQIVWSDARTIPGDADDQIDAAGAADDRGSVQFSSLKLIYIRNTGTTEIRLGADGAWQGGPNGAATYSIPAGGAYLATNPSAAGWIVGASPQYITVSNMSSSPDATYDIVLIGEGTVT